MFDIGWSELLVLGVVALIVIGPKDLPIVLRTIGRYAGIVKRQAAEFRAQFEEAIREAELDSLKKDVEGIGRDVETTVRDASRNVENQFEDAERSIEAARTSGGEAAETGASPATSEPNALAEPGPSSGASAGSEQPAQTTGRAEASIDGEKAHS